MESTIVNRISLANSGGSIIKIQCSGWGWLKIIFYCLSHTGAVGILADKTILVSHGGFDGFHRIGWSGEAMGIFQREHGQVIHVVAGGKDCLRLDAQAARDL